MVVTARFKKPDQTFLLDRGGKRVSRFALLHPHVVSSKAHVRDLMPRATRGSLWISYAPDLTETLVRAASSAQLTLGLGLFLHTLDLKTIPALTSEISKPVFLFQ